MYKKETNTMFATSAGVENSFNRTESWHSSAIFYHLFPLGFLPQGQTSSRENSHSVLQDLITWIPHIKALGANAILLGPVFHSMTHGYDIIDYSSVDPRLGTNEDLKDFVAQAHRQGLKVALDAVFHHTGRNFFPFQDLRAKGWDSAFRDWFSGLNFDTRSPLGDPFNYESWRGHMELVKLNLNCPQVIDHHLSMAEMWIRDFRIDGLRLDVADCLDLNFQSLRARLCRELQPDFWLMGEVVHGDYNQWANPGRLDSTTNYEMYKSLYSALNDGNFFEAAYALNRQYNRESGIYRNLDLYNFIDNHDVNRIASTLKDSSHLIPIHLLLFTIPGIPSLYYGSEWSLPGLKAPDSDAPLRPSIHANSGRLVCRAGGNSLDLPLSSESLNGALPVSVTDGDLTEYISRLAEIRETSPSLSQGDYEQVMVDHKVFAFSRSFRAKSGSGAGNIEASTMCENTLIAVNSDSVARQLETEISITLTKELDQGQCLICHDLLSNDTFHAQVLSPQNRASGCGGDQTIRIRISVPIPASQGRILRIQPL